MINFPEINFCQNCGGATHFNIPKNDDRKRYICGRCGYIHYQNPRLVVCTLATNKEGKVLLARRNIEPRINLWTLPGGFLELNENLEEGAKREMEEETYCKVKMLEIFSIISLPFAAQIHLFFTGELQTFSDKTTFESNAVKMFTPQNIPWNEIAFRTVSYSLKYYFNMMTKDDSAIKLNCATIDREGNYEQKQ